MLEKILLQTRFNRSPFNEGNVWVYTDSALRGKTLTPFAGLTDQTVLFSFAKKNKTLKDWIDYMKVIHQMPGGNGKRTKNELFDSFIRSSAYDYYKDHLEEYNKDFAFQLKEFREGNLLFEVMQHTIWDKASSDSASLKTYYETHKEKYWWEASADAILFTAANDKAAQDLKSRLEQDPASWKKWVELSTGLAQADSGRFELSQLSVPEKTHFAAGLLTDFVKNPADNTIGFSYILRVYPDRSPRNYKDARGFVINDYQGWLEDQWIGELKRKYPVKVDERVFATLPK
jgi:peptidyl-prolyl cis-trans isomerase SurA